MIVIVIFCFGLEVKVKVSRGEKVNGVDKSEKRRKKEYVIEKVFSDVILVVVMDSKFLTLRKVRELIKKDDFVFKVFRRFIREC